MFEQQAEHIAYIIAEAVKRKATTVEPSIQAQEAWGATIKEVAMDTSAFDLSCTPGYYNNEGRGFGEGVRSFLGDYFMPGFYAFDDLLKQWREKGDLDGLELGT
jgi:cyclohexanone monooxygenase